MKISCTYEQREWFINHACPYEFCSEWAYRDSPICTEECHKCWNHYVEWDIKSDYKFVIEKVPLGEKK